MFRRLRRRTEAQVRVVVALLVVSLLSTLAPILQAPATASAAPSAAVADVPLVSRSQTASMTAALVKRSPSVAPTGSIEVTVTGTLGIPVDGLSVRLRVRRPNGRLVYQRTVERYAVPRGRFDVGFQRALDDLDLKEGRYSLEAYVTAEGMPPVTLTDRLFVLKPDRRPLSVVVVTRFDYTPMMDPEGRFVLDPSRETRTRDEVSSLASFVARASWLKLTLGVPPLMLDEWRRITSGYQVADASGVTPVDKTAPVVGMYASALGALRKVAADPRVQLLNVPYADPDLSGLRTMGAMDDLQRQYDRGFSVYSASLGATPSAGTASLGDSVPQSALRTLIDGGERQVLLKPAALAVSGDTTPEPGVYTIKGSRVRAMVIDERASALLQDKGSSADGLLDDLFGHLVSSSSSRPIVVSVHLGPGSRTDVASLERMLSELARTGWVRFNTAEFASNTRFAPPGELRASSSPGQAAPYGYWQDLGLTREYARAFVDAVSQRDDDAMRALYATFVAESRYWAGPDGRWGLAERGRSFTRSALVASRDVLDKVSVTTETITLSGASGKIPLSVKNGSGKTLTVFVVASASNARFPSGRRVRVTLRPADNFVTVPVDLGPGGLSDHVRISVVSGRVSLAETTVDVNASYLDRLALVALVIVLLGAILFYIRSKVRAASADT